MVIRLRSLSYTFHSSDCLTSLIFIQITSPLTWTTVVPFRALDILFLGKQMYSPSSEQLARLYVKFGLLP